MTVPSVTFAARTRQLSGAVGATVQCVAATQAAGYTGGCRGNLTIGGRLSPPFVKLSFDSTVVPYFFQEQ